MATVPSVTTQTTGGTASAAWANSVKSGIDFFTTNLPIVAVKQGVAQSIPDSAWTALTFATETVDSDGMHSTSTNTARLTAVTAGYYRVVGRYAWASHASVSRRLVGVRKNGTGTGVPDQGFIEVASVAGASGAAAFPKDLIQLAVGDYLELMVYQNSGGALNTGIATELFSEFSAVWVRS